MAMDAILATIADGEQEIVGIDREASRNKLISCLIFTVILNLWWWPCRTPSAEAPGGGVCSTIETMPLERQTAPSWWVCLCAVCFASKKPSEWEFFVPAGNDLAVKLFNENILQFFSFLTNFHWFLLIFTSFHLFSLIFSFIFFTHLHSFSLISTFTFIFTFIFIFHSWRGGVGWGHWWRVLFYLWEICSNILTKLNPLVINSTDKWSHSWAQSKTLNVRGLEDFFSAVLERFLQPTLRWCSARFWVVIHVNNRGLLICPLFELN